MELKQRKKINNLPKFDIGQDAYNQFKQQFSINKPLQFGGSSGIRNGSGGNFNLSTGNAIQDARNKIGSLTYSKSAAGSTGGGLGGVSAGTVTGAVNGTIGMIQGYNSMQDAVKGTDELMAYSGQRTDQAFGVNYQAQNDINRQKVMSDISKSNRNATLGMVGSGAAAGAAIGSVVPGVGTLIGGAVGAITGLFGGLFGSKKARERQRRKVFNAQQQVNLINQVNQSSAATEGLTQQYYLDNGNTYDDVLYANRGKDLIKPIYVKRK